jgi:2,2-dialkylglycine decarboxylase (pyruvate)
MDQELRQAAKDLLIRYGGDSFPSLFRSARGAVVTDDEGREILDFTSGQMCATVGHNHPAIVAAIKESCDTAIHLFSGMIPETVVKLAQKLGEWLPPPLKRSLFVNTGSEANEAALRIAKLATGGYEVIALGGSWHGTTGASAAASYASDRRGYGPKVPGGHVIPEPNAYRCPVEHCRDTCDMTCLRIGLKMFDMASDGAPAAAIVEPVISAGGVIVPPEGYFEAVREACDARGMLLIFDEAQTAFGRVGDRFAATKLGVTPDIMSVSKTLGGGVPLAATITSEALEEKAHKAGFTYYTSHVSDPLPAAVGLAVLETIEREALK